MSTQNTNGRSRKKGVEQPSSTPGHAGNEKTGAQPIEPLPINEWVEEIPEKTREQISDLVAFRCDFEKCCDGSSVHVYARNVLINAAAAGFEEAMKEFHRYDYKPFSRWDKDPRWDSIAITEPIMDNAWNRLSDPDMWGGNPPASEDNRLVIEEIIAEAVLDAFNLAIREVQQLCNAFAMYVDESEFPRKYLPR